MDLNSPLVPAIFTIIGVIIGGLFSNIIPHFLQIRAEYKKFRKSKLEDLYNDLCNWLNTSSFLLIFNFKMVLKKEIDWNKYLDLINESDASEKIQFYKSEMIVNLYYKEFITDLNNLILLLRSLYHFINHDIKKTYLSGIDIRIHQAAYDEKVSVITTSIEQFKDKIKKLAQRI
jgi:hypothetical protein